MYLGVHINHINSLLIGSCAGLVAPLSLTSNVCKAAVLSIQHHLIVCNAGHFINNLHKYKQFDALMRKLNVYAKGWAK